MQENNQKNLQILGKHIKNLRQKHKMKLETFSYYVGVEPSTISRIERGKAEPKYLTLKNIAEALGYNLSKFFENIEQ